MILGRGHTHFALPELSLKGPAVVIIPTIASSPHYSTKEQQTLQYAKEHEVESSLLVSASELTFGGLLSRLVYTYTVCVPVYYDWCILYASAAPTTLLLSPSTPSSFKPFLCKLCQAGGKGQSNYELFISSVFGSVCQKKSYSKESTFPLISARVSYLC